MESDFTDDDWPHHLLEYLPSGVLFEIFRNLTWQELCCVAQTCTRFQSLCDKATLWHQLHTMDFTKCSIPIAEKMLGILRKCPNIDTILINGVIIERSLLESDLDLVESVDSNIVGFDNFMLDILRQCPKLETMVISNPEMTNSSIDAICAKCTKLRELSIEDTFNITNNAIIDLVSISSLRKLKINSCENIVVPEIFHRDGEDLPLNITHLSLCGIAVSNNCIRSALVHCRCLKVLDLSSSWGISHFKFQDLPVQNGLNSLKRLILRSFPDLFEVQLPLCPKLLYIDVKYCNSLTSLVAAAPSLKVLKASHLTSLRKLELVPSSLEVLNLNFPYLEELHISSENLQTLSLIQCSRLTCDTLMTAIPHKDTLTCLHIEECRLITQEDIQEVVLQKFPRLESFTLLHESFSPLILEEFIRPWIDIKINSPVLKQLHFGVCKRISCLPMNIPSLSQLKMSSCRDIVESDFIDGLLYGKQIKRARGIDGLIKEMKTDDLPFTGGVGVPNLRELNLIQMAGIQGDVLSQNLWQFKHLSTLTLEQCAFLKQLNLEQCPCLETISVRSCSRLTKFTVRQLARLICLDVIWCSMLQQFSVHAERLEKLDVTGTNFAHFIIESREITQVSLSGVCTQDGHTLKIRCPKLKSLSIQKCDTLTDDIMQRIMGDCPDLSSITLTASPKTRCLTIPSSTTEYSLTAHRMLREIIPEYPIHVQHLTLNNLPKFVPDVRYKLLKECETSLKVLDVRAIPGEKEINLDLCNLTSLTLDQGIHLNKLEISCPKLSYLRIQGCPRLSTFTLKIDKLSRLQVSHSSPLLNLQTMKLSISHIRHLSRVLGMYCPNLHHLQLSDCHVTYNQVIDLGKVMRQLRTIQLEGCSTEGIDSLPFHIQPGVIGRNTPISLTVSHCHNS